jgi:asparagine synthase (glutamine-hydrolysing)
MAHSLESRNPFLDHRVVEFAAGLPVEWKLRGFRTKAILKDSQERHLPRETLRRKKRGFNAPVSNWFSGELMSIGKQATYDTGLRDWISTAALDKLWRTHANRHEDNGLKLFGLACLGLWLEQHRVAVNG